MAEVSRILESYLWVEDTERAAEFYKELFGFEVYWPVVGAGKTGRPERGREPSPAPREGGGIHAAECYSWRSHSSNRGKRQLPCCFSNCY